MLFQKNESCSATAGIQQTKPIDHVGLVRRFDISGGLSKAVGRPVSVDRSTVVRHRQPYAFNAFGVDRLLKHGVPFSADALLSDCAR